MPSPARHPRRLWLCAALIAFATSCDSGGFGPAPVGSVRIIDPPATLAIGETVTLTAEVLDLSNDPLPDAKVYWGAEDTTIVQVDSVTGAVRAREAVTASRRKCGRHVLEEDLRAVPHGDAVDCNHENNL